MTDWTASEMGKKGGRSRSPRKLAAIAENRKLGGAKRRPDHLIKPESLKRRIKRDEERGK